MTAIDQRSEHQGIRADIASFAVVGALFGFTFGLSAELAGLSWIRATIFSALAFAGASQFATIAILTLGGPAITMFATVVLLNARFVPLSLTAAARIRETGWKRAAAPLVMTDLSSIFALRGPDHRTSRRWYWLGGLTVWSTWITGTALGGLAAANLSFDPATLGLDAALPALLLAVSWSALRDRHAVGYLIAGGVGVIVALPHVSAGTEFAIVGVAATIIAFAGVGSNPPSP